MAEHMYINIPTDTQAEPVSPMQALALVGAMRASGAGSFARLRADFCSCFGVEEVDALPASSFSLAQEWLYSRCFETAGA